MASPLLTRSHSETRMGWDLNTRTTFAVAGFQGRQRGLRDSRHEHPRKQGRSAPETVQAEPTGAWSKTRNRDKPRHNETNRDHTPDKSATSRDRPIPKRLEMATSGDRPARSPPHRLPREGHRGPARPLLDARVNGLLGGSPAPAATRHSRIGCGDSEARRCADPDANPRGRPLDAAR